MHAVINYWGRYIKYFFPLISSLCTLFADSRSVVLTNNKSGARPLSLHQEYVIEINGDDTRAINLIIISQQSNLNLGFLSIKNHDECTSSEKEKGCHESQEGMAEIFQHTRCRRLSWGTETAVANRVRKMHCHCIAIYCIAIARTHGGDNVEYFPNSTRQ